MALPRQALSEAIESLRSKERKCREKEESQVTRRRFFAPPLIAAPQSRLLEAVQKSHERLHERLEGLRDRLAEQEDSETVELLAQLEQSREGLKRAMKVSRPC